jgi:ubiquinone/menaquinone biosynthesis C-methylase UbiE
LFLSGGYSEVCRVNKLPNFNARLIRDLAEEIYSAAFKRSLFDAISGSYDRVNNVANLGMPVVIRKSIFRRLLKGDQRNVRVLDLMSGCGENFRTIAALYPNAEVTAVDFSQRMSERSVSLGRKFFGKRITVVNADIFETQLNSDHYDLVVCSFGIKCLSDLHAQTFAQLVKRVLKREGRYLFIEVGRPGNVFLSAMFDIHFRYAVPLLGGAINWRLRSYRVLSKYVRHFKVSLFADLIKNENLQADVRSHFFGTVITLSN